MDKNKLIIIGAAAAFLVIAVCMFIPEKKTEEKPAQKPKNETPDIPDGDTQQVSTSKKEGYERGTARNRNSAADIYWNGQEETQITHEQVRQSSEEMFGRGTQATADGNIGINMDLYTPDFLAEGCQHGAVGFVGQIVRTGEFFCASGDLQTLIGLLKGHIGMQLQSTAKSVKTGTQVGRSGRHTNGYFFHNLTIP